MSRGGQFWSERTVAWYRRAIERSDYAPKVLAPLAPLLDRCETALDVGAGPGALAIPLAERLRQITALEPAPAMAEALRAQARARGLGNLTVVQAAWEQWPVEPHDLVLCAQVGELLRPGARFLHEAATVARRGVAFVRDADRDRDKFFFRELYPRLLGRPYVSSCHWEETVEGLAALGVAPTVSFVDYRSDQPFADLEDACDFYEAYLGLEPGATRTFLREFLARRLVREADAWVAPYPKRAAVIWWPIADSQMTEPSDA